MQKKYFNTIPNNANKQSKIQTKKKGSNQKKKFQSITQINNKNFKKIYRKQHSPVGGCLNPGLK